MNSHTNFYKIGIFVLAFFVLFILFVFWLGKYGMSDKRYDTYFVNFNESISGLNIGSAVKFMGYEIGFVDQITIDKDRDEEIKVQLNILKDTPIKDDHFANLGSVGITGLKYIELKGGSSHAKLLKPNDTIKSQKSTLNTIEEFAIDFSKEFLEIMRISKTILSNENINNFSKTLENSSNLTKKMDIFLDYLVRNEKKFDRLIDSLEKFSIEGEKSFISMGKTADEYDEFVQELKEELAQGNFDLKNISQDTLRDLELLINSLNNLVQKLEESPSDLLLKKKVIKNGPGE